MSIAFTEHNRLATPVELASVPPPDFAHTFEPVELGPRYDGTPEHVLKARAFADAHRTSPAALVQLAQAEQSVGEDRAAIAAASQALAEVSQGGDDPVVFAAVQVLLSYGCIEDATKSLTKINNEELRDLLRARVAIQSGELDAAAELLDGLGSSEALATRGWIDLQLGRFDKAIRLFRKALEGEAPTAPVLTNLGYAHAALGAREKAIRVTRQARAIAPGDELVGFNLVSFYVADENLEAARGELERLRQMHPRRLRFDLAEADLFLHAGHPERAFDVLRRARTSVLWAYAEPQELAELEANLAFVEWRLGRKSSKAAATEVASQLERTDFRSLDIARLIPALLAHRDDALQLDQLLESLAANHTADELLFLKTHIALVHFEFDRATQLAKEWAEKEIFNTYAVSLAVYLLADVAGTLDEAISLGKRGCRIAGAAEQLVNNLAYAYALAGNLSEARDLLRVPHHESVYMTATEGLIEILSGNRERGSWLYDRSYELACQQSSSTPNLSQLVQLNKALALYRAGASKNVKLDMPERWERDPYLMAFRLAAERAGAEFGGNTSRAAETA
jgi:Flp pilus assembly protein TadD